MHKSIIEQGNSTGSSITTSGNDFKTRCICLKSECPWMKQLMIALRQNPYFSVARSSQVKTMIETCPKNKSNVFICLDGDSTLYDPMTMVHQIKQERPEAQIILFVRSLSQIQFYGYILAGINGAVSKEHDPKEIKKWLHPHQSEKTLFSPVFAKYLVNLVRTNEISQP